MSIYDCLINRFNMAKKQIFANNINLQLPRINNNAQSVEYVLKRFKKHKKDNFNDLRNFINFFEKEENIKNAINLVIDYTKNLIIAKQQADIINFMSSTKNIDLFLVMLPKKNNDINVITARKKILDIRQSIEKNEINNKLKDALRYEHYQIKNNSQNEWDKLPTCKTPDWNNVIDDFKECKKDNFDELKKFFESYKAEKDTNKAINLVIDYTKNIVIKDIKDISKATKAKDFIIAQKAHDIANFMGSNENIDLFLKKLPKQPNDDIKLIMKYAKHMITQDEQRNSSGWGIDGSRGSNVTTANSKTKLPPIKNPNNSNNLPRR